MCLCAGEKAQMAEMSNPAAKHSWINEISLNSKHRCPVGQPTPKHRIVKFPASTMNYLPPGAQELIINPVDLLQIYCAHSGLQVSKYLTYGAFQLFTPWNGAAGVRVSPLGWQRAKQTAVLLQPAGRVGAVAAFPTHSSPSLPCLALSIYQNTLQAPVWAPPQPACIARFMVLHSVCCGALTLGITQTGHSVWSVCVSLSSGWFWIYSDSLAGWAMATTGGPEGPVDMTPHTLSILPDRHAYLKEDSLSPSLLRSIIFHWATEQTWQSWQAIAVGWACNSSPALPLTHTHTHTHTHTDSHTHRLICRHGVSSICRACFCFYRQVRTVNLIAFLHFGIVRNASCKAASWRGEKLFSTFSQILFQFLSLSWISHPPQNILISLHFQVSFRLIPRKQLDVSFDQH